jgi:hypothetical protein
MPSIWLIAVAIAGVVLLVRGTRGRLVDKHPYCERCGFDLVASLPAPCPECGSDTDAPNSVRVGRWERKRRSLWTGIGLLAFVAVAVSLRAIGLVSRADINAWKPLWMLRREVASGTPGFDAVSELTARVGLRQLSQDQIDAVARSFMAAHDTGHYGPQAIGKPLASIIYSNQMSNAGRQEFMQWVLSLQRDGTRPWSSDVGAAAETLLLAPHAAPEWKARYMSQVLRPKLRLATSAPLRPGQQVPVYLQSAFRAGPRSVAHQLVFPPEIRQNPVWASSLMGPEWEPVGFLTAPQQVGDHLALATCDFVLTFRRDDPGLVSVGGEPDPAFEAIQQSVPLELRYRVEAQAPGTHKELITAMFWCSGARPSIFNANDVQAEASLWVTPCSESMHIEFDMVWRYDERDHDCGVAEISLSNSGSSVTLKQPSGNTLASSHSGGPLSRPEQLSFSVPVGPRGPESGSIKLTIKSFQRDTTGTDSEFDPFVIELPDIPVRR